MSDSSESEASSVVGSIAFGTDDCLGSLVDADGMDPVCLMPEADALASFNFAESSAAPDLIEFGVLSGVDAINLALADDAET